VFIGACHPSLSWVRWRSAQRSIRFSNIHFNIILLSTRKFSDWSLPVKLPIQNFASFYCYINHYLTREFFDEYELVISRRLQNNYALACSSLQLRITNVALSVFCPVSALVLIVRSLKSEHCFFALLHTLRFVAATNHHSRQSTEIGWLPAPLYYRPSHTERTVQQLLGPFFVRYDSGSLRTFIDMSAQLTVAKENCSKHLVRWVRRHGRRNKQLS
jgi:hypothetical protein